MEGALPFDQIFWASQISIQLDFRDNAKSLRFCEPALPLIEREEDVGLQDQGAGHLEDIEGTRPKGRGVTSGELLRTSVGLYWHRSQCEYAASQNPGERILPVTCL